MTLTPDDILEETFCKIHNVRINGADAWCDICGVNDKMDWRHSSVVEASKVADELAHIYAVLTANNCMEHSQTIVLGLRKMRELYSTLTNSSILDAKITKEPLKERILKEMVHTETLRGNEMKLTQYQKRNQKYRHQLDDYFDKVVTEKFNERAKTLGEQDNVLPKM